MAVKEPKYVQQKSEAYRALWQEYKQLAKQADQRLVRIEKLSQQEGFGNVKQYAYRKALADIRQYSGSGETRYNKKAPDNYQELLGKVNSIREFLDSPSSTKKGIIDTYKKKADTFNKKYGTSFTWESMAKFWMSGAGDKAKALGYASKTIMRTIGKMQKFDSDKIKDIQDAEGRVTIVEGHKIHDTIAQRLLDEGLTFKDLQP